MIYAFDDFEFDEGRWELRRAGTALVVPLKVMQILGLLLRNRDRVVSNEELLAGVWPGVTVTDASVTKAIRTARRLLGDDGDAQRIIRTTRGRGYRLVCDVDERAEPVRLPSEPPPSRQGRAVTSADVFVSRDRELAELIGRLELAAGKRGSLLLIAGEPGLGKTRLLEAFASLAASAHARVSWGRAYPEAGAPELWPWLQILRGLREEGLGERDASVAHALRILGEVHATDDAASDFTAFPSEAARFRIFDAIARSLRQSSEQKPLVVLFEDLHSADQASLRLLRLLGRELRDARVVIVASFRPEHDEGEAGVSPALAELVRESDVINLAGLDEQATGELLGVLLPHVIDAELIQRIHRLTDGNPFFLHEIVRLVSSSGISSLREGVVPRGLNDAVKSRLEGLPSASRELLAVASVIGQEFELPLLQAAILVSETDLHGALEPVLKRRILQQAPAALGAYRFTHLLLRDVCYAALAPTHRAELHRRVGESLERSAWSGSDPAPALLAHHFSQASLGGDSERVARYSLEAGRHALRALAFEEAVEHCERALQALRFESEGHALRADVLITLGQALRRVGDYSRARETLLHGLSAAKALDDPLRVARAALGFAQVRPETGDTNEKVARMLRDAAERLERAPELDRAEIQDALSQVLARLSAGVVVTGTNEEADALSFRALELARSSGKPQTLAHALLARHWALWQPGAAEQRLSIAQEIITLERALAFTQPATEARVAQITDLLELGDPSALGAALAEFVEVAERAHDPSARYSARILETTRAMLEGRFEQAEHQAEQAVPMGARLHEESARKFYAAELWWIRVEQGRALEIEAVSRQVTESRPEDRSRRGALLRLYAESGAVEPTRRQLSLLRPPANEQFAKDWLLLPTLSHLAVASAMLGDRERATSLCDELTAFDGHHVVVGPAIVYLGPVSFYIALCERVLSQLDACVERFQRAILESERLGARPFATRAAYHLSDALLARAAPGDQRRAVEQLQAAVQASSEMGMLELNARCQGLLKGLFYG